MVGDHQRRGLAVVVRRQFRVFLQDGLQFCQHFLPALGVELYAQAPHFHVSRRQATGLLQESLYEDGGYVRQGCPPRFLAGNVRYLGGSALAFPALFREQQPGTYKDADMVEAGRRIDLQQLGYFLVGPRLVKA